MGHEHLDLFCYRAPDFINGDAEERGSAHGVECKGAEGQRREAAAGRGKSQASALEKQCRELRGNGGRRRVALPTAEESAAEVNAVPASSRKRVKGPSAEASQKRAVRPIASNLIAAADTAPTSGERYGGRESEASPRWLLPTAAAIAEKASQRAARSTGGRGRSPTEVEGGATDAPALVVDEECQQRLHKQLRARAAGNR